MFLSIKVKFSKIQFKYGYIYSVRVRIIWSGTIDKIIRTKKFEVEKSVKRFAVRFVPFSESLSGLVNCLMTVILYGDTYFVYATFVSGWVRTG